MDSRQRTKRFCKAMILWAVVLRLCTSGLPELLLYSLRQVDIPQLLTYLETGRNVRFSASSEVFSPFFRESPGPWIPEQTLPVFSGEEQVDVTYGCSLRPEVEALLRQNLQWDLTGEAPTVLILHTHTTESYTKAGEAYEESGAYRTLEAEYNMLSIGSRVAQLLQEGGLSVIHDRSVHDYPSYNGSYTHARKSIEAHLQEHPSIRLVLDLHRDAMGSTAKQLRTQAWVEGRPSAQLMLVLGTDAGGLHHPGWQENLSLGLKLHAQLERQHPGIMRPLYLRAQRFNQDLCPGALLVEVGAAGNTHAEALTAAQVLAEGILALARGTA